MLPFLLLAGTVMAEEKFGAKIYPGDKIDVATSKALAENMGLVGAAYQKIT